MLKEVTVSGDEKSSERFTSFLWEKGCCLHQEPDRVSGGQVEQVYHQIAWAREGEVQGTNQGQVGEVDSASEGNTALDR